jgi:hypothetical protein
LAVANSITQNVANANLRDFLFAGTKLSDMHMTGWNYQDGSGRNNYNSIVTLSEIFRNTQGTASGGHDRPKPVAQMVDNLKENWIGLAVGVVGIPMVAKVATKLMRKPLLTPLNKAIKMTGLDVKV